MLTRLLCSQMMTEYAYLISLWNFKYCWEDYKSLICLFFTAFCTFVFGMIYFYPCVCAQCQQLFHCRVTVLFVPWQAFCRSSIQLYYGTNQSAYMGSSWSVDICNLSVLYVVLECHVRLRGMSDSNTSSSFVFFASCITVYILLLENNSRSLLML